MQVEVCCLVEIKNKRMIRTLGVQCQVFRSIWTLKHHRVLDLLHQQLQEVLLGHVAVLEAAGKRSPSLFFEPGRGVDEKRQTE